MIEQHALYAALDLETRAFVQEKAQAIHARLKRTAEDVIAIGWNLVDAQEKLAKNGYGCFQAWIDCEFGMTPRTAYNFINVARKFDYEKISQTNFSVSVLYELAAPLTPETVIKMVESGEIPATISAIREAKRAQQEQAQESIIPQYEELTLSASLPPSFGLVNGEPFTLPLPDGKPVEVPDAWKLPQEMRGDAPIKSAALTALQSSESNEWYTPAQYIDAARKLMGGIDIDPASNEIANRIIRATRYYTKQEDGLSQPWSGRIWLNPPYGFENGISNQETWTKRLIECYQAGQVQEAVLLVNANTEAKWFQPLYDYLICFTNHRIRFYSESGESSQPTQGNALVYFGKQEQRFIELFRQFGNVVRRAMHESGR